MQMGKFESSSTLVEADVNKGNGIDGMGESKLNGE